MASDTARCAICQLTIRRVGTAWVDDDSETTCPGSTGRRHVPRIQDR